MLKIRTLALALGILMSPLASADTQVSIGIGLPHVSIGINLPAYPQLVVVPGYPVYYAPRLRANYFFYDGLYWVFRDDNWYASSWYNGPWWFVEPYAVPVHILRVPVRYSQPAFVFPCVALEYAAALGRSLGTGVGAASKRLGSLGPPRRAAPRPAASLPAAVFGRSLSPTGGTAA